MGTKPDPKYLAAWRKMRVSNTVLLAAAVIYLPGGMIVDRNFGTLAMVAWFVAVAVAFGLLGASGRKIRCPRCGKPFVSDKRAPLLNACGGCDLPYGARRDPDAA